MPSCGCAAQRLHLTGFQLAPDLGSVEVRYQCASCGKAAKGDYVERPRPAPRVTHRVRRLL